MGFFTAFDHHRLASDLDAATWDSYPLGFLEQFWFPPADKKRYARQGHPDVAAFHHDLYRGCGRGRMWVMEQQPGPVNWARNNPAPLPDMVRLWTLEALAHGAELLSYFRWRQAPFGQEQMHAGLLRPDSSESEACDEVRAAGRDMKLLGELAVTPAPVALVFSYEAAWLLDIQPQGEDFQYLQLAFAMYTALRRLGLDVDIVGPDASLQAYAMVVCPSLPISDPALAARLSDLSCPILLGPRSGSKTHDFSIPPQLPPGDLQRIIPLKVSRVESLRPGLTESGGDFTIERWLEQVETDLSPEISLPNGRGIVFRNGGVRYCAAWPDEALLLRLFARMAQEAQIAAALLQEAVRTRRHGGLRFAFNYGQEPASLHSLGLPPGAYVLGGPNLPPAGVAAWRDPIRREAGAGAAG
jgi:beta-galactosidase